MTYIPQFFVPSTKHVAFERDGVIILWNPVVEDVLHVLVGRVDVEHEAVEALPPLDVVHQGDLLPVGALEDGLGALDVVHHVLAGGELSLVESSASSFICGDMSCAHHHHRESFRGTSDATKGLINSRIRKKQGGEQMRK